MRDYNRNNTAIFSVLTDGRKWRFYLCQTGGEFYKKCFKELDLLDKSETTSDIEIALNAFLSKEKIANGQARRDATQYLSSSRRQRAMRDALPLAKRDIDTNPDQGLAQLLVRRLRKEGREISETDAKKFILEVASQSANTETLSNRNEREERSTVRSPSDPSPSQFKFKEIGTKAPTPSAMDWVSKVPELNRLTHLRTWKDICDHLKIAVGRDSARRKLQKWVKEKHPRWHDVPSV